MRFEDHLTKEQKQKLNQMSKSKKKRKRKRKPQEEKIDWADIMGTNNRGLRRKKGGAWSN